MVTVDFLIAGARKSGTSSLHNYLLCHPEIFMPKREVGYFSDNHYDEGIQWYMNHFKNIPEGLIVGEKCPVYMFNNGSPERIYLYNKMMKLIFILRHPVDRLYSNYWHDKRQGKIKKEFYEYASEFIKKEQSSDPVFSNEIYVSEYRLHYYQYKKYFSDEQMLFVSSEDLNNKPMDVLKKIYRFLDVDEYIPSNLYKKYNVGGKPKSMLISSLVKKTRFLPDDTYVLPKIPIRFLSALNQPGMFFYKVYQRSPMLSEMKPFSTHSLYPQMDKGIYDKLCVYFTDDIKFWEECMI